MATAVFKPPPYLCNTAAGGSTFEFRSLPCVCFVSSKLPELRSRVYGNWRGVELPTRSVLKFSTFVADGGTAETEVETQMEDRVEGSESETEIEWNAGGVDASGETNDTAAEECNSAIRSQLNLYKEALANKDEAKVVEVESFLKTLEDEKEDLQKRVVALSEELSYEKDRVLRISAGFDSFRKRTETERLSLISTARGEVVESLLPILDHFEQAKAQIKVETEGEEKISRSYESIHKQFVEILASLGVASVEAIENTFDPMVEAGSGFSRVIDELFKKLYKVGSRVMKRWMRI